MSTRFDAPARAAIRTAIGIGVTTGAYALSFGAISVAAGLSTLQACLLSLVMFTGGSQFAFVGVVAGGGAPLAAAASAGFLGIRNALYGLRLAPLLGLTGSRRALGAQFVIDETTAVAISRPDEKTGRVGFWATGISVFMLWNAGTLIGALGAQALAGPKVLGFDAAVPAAFLALLGPMISTRQQAGIAVAGAVIALATVTFLPVGLPILVVAFVVVGFGLFLGRRQSE